MECEIWLNFNRSLLLYFVLKNFKNYPLPQIPLLTETALFSRMNAVYFHLKTICCTSALVTECFEILGH